MRYDISVLGLGYIGLPTSAVFATKGRRVLGVDIVPAVVETINSGKIHIEEPDLDLIVRAAVQSGNLCAATAPQPAETFIIAVPTPFSATLGGRKIPDLTFVEAAARSLAPVIAEDNLVVLESTSPVGTTERVRGWLADELAKRHSAINIEKIHFAHCPERILPGQMIRELISNDRVVGGFTPEAAVRAKALYASFCAAEIFITDARTAEMTKLTENAFRDVNIAFANELSLICEKIGINVWELIRLANRHPRVKILQPGPGVGGHCIAVDPWFIVDAAPEDARVIRVAREVNDSKPKHVIAKIRQAVSQNAASGVRPVVALLGLAFKANVDDLRESPAVEIALELANSDPPLQILAVEPHIHSLPPALVAAKIELSSLDAALERANSVVLLVDHNAFKSIPVEKLSGKKLVDTRGIWSDMG
ncbi:MAG: UDP-N-acetyl-D-mannosamine dehydrogenase [Puniceicoccales bacterium]|nr:UDP-N-acetyl-D-mannosamine dehydrogenase [Puniceicoccales bacterium]